MTSRDPAVSAILSDLAAINARAAMIEARALETIRSSTIRMGGPPLARRRSPPAGPSHIRPDACSPGGGAQPSFLLAVPPSLAGGSQQHIAAAAGLS